MNKDKIWSLVSNSSLESLQFRKSVYYLQGNHTLKCVFHCRLSNIKSLFPSKNSHKKSSWFKVCLPLKVFFHQILATIEIRLPSKLVFYPRSPFIKGRLPSKVIFHQRCLPSKVVFHQRLSSIKGRLPTSSSGCDRGKTKYYKFARTCRLIVKQELALWWQTPVQYLSFLSFVNDRFNWAFLFLLLDLRESSIIGCPASKIVFNHML